MQEYEIWSEGCVRGKYSLQACYHGKAKGIDFKDACINLAYLDFEFRDKFDAKNLTYFGCKLFDNEKHARRKNG